MSNVEIILVKNAELDYKNVLAYVSGFDKNKD